MNNRIADLEAKLDRQTGKYLQKLRRREAKLRKKLNRKDSLASASIFADADYKYSDLDQKLKIPQKYKDYIPYLDTLTTSLKFLEQNKLLTGVNAQIPQNIKSALANIRGLESRLQQAENIKQFLKDRKQFLQEHLGKFGFGRELKKLNKDVYYYSQYVNEYKAILQDPQKLERKAIELLSKTAVFQDFLRKHSFLASIFRVPGEAGSASFQVNAAGLQTRAQISQVVQQQFGSTGINPVQSMQQNIQQAQNQLQQIKGKIANLGNSDDSEAPNFQPNKQKTKSFLQRLELGTNIQTQRATNYFPATSDIGLSVGYKLNDKSILGVGMCYAIGLGSGWRDIQFSSEGVGLRSFVDCRLKGSFWVSGGYEMNYRNAFNDVDQLKDLNGWQQSGLLGISKTILLKTKVLKNTRISLLWDFLSYRQLPQTAALKLRLGYGFK